MAVIFIFIVIESTTLKTCLEKGINKQDNQVSENREVAEKFIYLHRKISRTSFHFKFDSP